MSVGADGLVSGKGLQLCGQEKKLQEMFSWCRSLLASWAGIKSLLAEGFAD